MGSIGLLSGGHFLKAIRVAMIESGAAYREGELEASRHLGKFLSRSLKITRENTKTKQQPKKAERHFANEF